MATPFTPKQALPFDGALLKEIMGGISDAIARDLLADDLPPLTTSSVIHDNGCGAGTVTEAIMASHPPSGIMIHATDINPMYLQQAQATLTENPEWPVTLQNMDACDLTFGDEIFDLSVTSFVFDGLRDDVAATRHILRTLKPGGTAAIAVWKEKPWEEALRTAHRKTRGETEPLPRFLDLSGYGKGKIEKNAKEVGWKDVEFIEKVGWCQFAGLERWATLAWSLLGAPFGGWTQSDEEKWEDAIKIIVQELEACEWYKVEDGVHKIRMVADVAIGHK